MIKEISSLQNPLIKQLVLLKEKSRERKKSGLFLIEGKREISLAIKGDYNIETVFYNPEIISNKEISELISFQCNLIEISKSVFQKLAYRDTTEGILAVTKSKSHAIDNLNQSMGLVIDHEAFTQLRKLTRRDLVKGISNPSKYYDLMTICLEEGNRRLFKKKQAKNQRLLGDIVDLAHDLDQMSSPMSLSDVCRHLNSGQASLYRVCQDYFGMGIIEMMTQVRLEEARRSMIYYSTTSDYDNNTIREIAIRFGFKHQGRFSRRYFTSFGELPSQTLKRSKLL